MFRSCLLVIMSFHPYPPVARAAAPARNSAQRFGAESAVKPRKQEKRILQDAQQRRCAVALNPRPWLNQPQPPEAAGANLRA
jgi:hypothetical protein